VFAVVGGVRSFFIVVIFSSSFFSGLYLGIKHSHGGTGHEKPHAHKHKRRDVEADNSDSDESSEEDPDQWIKFYTEMYSLLFGLTFHSFFVGFALGLESEDLGLLIAILAHQFFEAISLGTRVARAGVKRGWQILLIDLIFSLAAPVGTAIGMGVQSTILDQPKTYDIVQGCFNGFSAGILIYVGILHLMVEEMERAANNRFHQFLTYVGIAAGATMMSILAIWA
jgi:zinc transporter ZupT